MNKMNNNQITKIKAYNTDLCEQNRFIDGLKIWFSLASRKKKKSVIHQEEKTQENFEASVHERVESNQFIPF